MVGSGFCFFLFSSFLLSVYVYNFIKGLRYGEESVSSGDWRNSNKIYYNIREYYNIELLMLQLIYIFYILPFLRQGYVFSYTVMGKMTSPYGKVHVRCISSFGLAM